MSHTFSNLRWLVVAACLPTSLAFAQSAVASPAAETHFRMQRSADIDKVLVNHMGEPFALLLGEGSVVMLSSQASHFGFAPGQRVQVEGDAVETTLNIVYFRVRLTRGGKLLQAISDVPARAPTSEDCAGSEVNARGKLQAFLAAPDGRITGLIFEDGTVALSTAGLPINAEGLSRGMKVEVSGAALAADGATALRIDRLTVASR